MYSIREDIINAFSDGIFPYIEGFQVEKESDDESTSENKEMDTTIMLELESEESAEQRTNQQGHGFKILTPDQMLSRLSISLAQIKSRK